MVKMLTILSIALLSLVSSARAGDFTPQALNFFFVGGRSQPNRHGQAALGSIALELTARSKLLDRHLAGTEVGLSLSGGVVRQASSWFGYQYGDPNQTVRTVELTVLPRHYWTFTPGTQGYLEFGTGPMWSSNRVPAKTSHFDVDTQLGFGLAFFRNSSTPLYFGYRFHHVSNGGRTHRNSGLEVHSLVLGTRLARWRR